ncbi:uncharacterized protein LOC135400854 isoform X2 [Ornithodoros turicata]|uniref:uncharacterized protein LOC135400854 isoform X2 n=1 Tax=Ornithodoros turicata TaxID=34597 RepID=UPI0031396D44
MSRHGVSLSKRYVRVFLVSACFVFASASIFNCDHVREHSPQRKTIGKNIHRSNVIKEFGKCSRLSTSVWGARRNRTVIMHDWKVALNNCRSDLGLTEGFHTQEKICNDPEVYYEIIACMRKKEPDSLRHKNATEKAKIESLMRCYKKAYQKYKEIIMK